MAIVAGLAGCGQPQVAQPLPALGADITKTSVSGLSAGAYMAGQFHLAYSDIVIGAGLIAGGPWGCAQSAFADRMPGPGQIFINVQLAINGCMHNQLQAWGVPNAGRLAERARKFAQDGRIDPLAAVAGDRIYLFAGRKDNVVVPEMSQIAARFYEQVGVPKDSIKLVGGYDAGHGFVTLDKGASCGKTIAPYIVDCDYDQAGDLLRQLRGRDAVKPESYSGSILVFDQSDFARKDADSSLAGEGVVYVPAGCREKSGCAVHVVFHGCEQNRKAVGNEVIVNTGMLRWADAYRLIVLYPQVQTSSVNPKGCWDWWGYSGDNFLVKSGAQLTAVRRMLERLSSAVATP